MRRSQRNKTRSLKAELEEDVRDTRKRVRLQSLEKKEGRCAPIRIRSEAEENSESDGDEEKTTDEEGGEVRDTTIESAEPCSEKTNGEGARGKGGGKVAGNKGVTVEEVVGQEVGSGGSGEGRWRHYHSLCSSLPGRERQIQLLLSLMGESHQVTCPALYVYGNTSTGKTLTVKTVLKTLEVPHAFVNCIECYSSKLLYRTVLAQLTGGQVRCDSMANFIRLLQSYASERSPATVYIVLDKAERLREMEATLLPALLRLSELTHSQVCTILVSELVREKLVAVTGGLQPYPLHFPQYSKNEVLAIMSLDCPEGEPLSFYRTFINHVWNVFQCVCRDLGELRYLSSQLYPKYCEPVETGEMCRQDTRRLWRHIEPFFRGVMSKIYLREISTTQWVKAQEQMETEDSTSASSLAQGICQSRAELELPHFSKYLLIASYLASYNPSKTDKKFFSKHRTGHSRKSKKTQKDKPNYQLLGPKPFPLDRLMAIFYSILEDPVAPSADIYSQISSLVTLQLVGRLHTKDPLDGPKYKCLVTLEAVRQLARTVGFDLVQYLYDFN